MSPKEWTRLSARELDALREHLPEEPKSVLLQILLSEIDSLKIDLKAKNRIMLRDSLKNNENLTEDEIYRVIEAMERGVGLAFEQGKCRACQGEGKHYRKVPTGLQSVDCQKCKGTGEKLRIKIP